MTEKGAALQMRARQSAAKQKRQRTTRKKAAAALEKTVALAVGGNWQNMLSGGISKTNTPLRVYQLSVLIIVEAVKLPVEMSDWDKIVPKPAGEWNAVVDGMRQ